MYALAIDFGVAGIARKYFAEEDGEWFLSDMQSVIQLFPLAEHFNPHMQAIREMLKMGDISDVDVWTDDRFEPEFSETGDDALEYTHHLRRIKAVTDELYTFIRDNPKAKVCLTVQEVKLKPFKTYPL